MRFSAASLEMQRTSFAVRDAIQAVRVPPGYADHPEDERIYTTPSLTLTNDSSSGDLLYHY